MHKRVAPWLLLGLLEVPGAVACGNSQTERGQAGAPAVEPSAGRDAARAGTENGAGQVSQGGMSAGNGGADGTATAAGAATAGTTPSGGGASCSTSGGSVTGGSASGGSAPAVGLGGCQIGKELHTDDFSAGVTRWVSELEEPATSKVSVKADKLDIDASAGATVWFSPVLQGNLLIDYDVTVVVMGGANDHLTDLNSFWMATDPKNANLFTRSGAFAQYNDLLLYYVGFGGSANTTTRIRRYDGNATRPEPLAEYLDAQHLLVENHAYHLQHVVCGKHVAYVVDGAAYFEIEDQSPYTSGRFGFRTMGSHQSIDNFRVRELLPQ